MDIFPPRDERQAGEVADLAAKVFSGYFETLRRGVAFLRHFPGFRLEMVRVAWEDGKPVSALTVLPLKVRLMGRELPAGGLRNVCTHPEFRGRGLATSLLLDALQFMRERGMLLSMLFTDIHDFYRRLGWEVALPSYRLSLDVRAARPGSFGTLFLSPFRDEDLDQIAPLYSKCYALTNCSIVRDRDYWLGKVALWDEISPGWRERLLVGRAGGEAICYAAVEWRDEALSVLEAGAESPESANALLRSLSRLALSRAKGRLELRLPPDHILSRRALELGASLSISPSPCMLRIVEIEPLFRAIEPELTLRLRATALKDWSGAISFETDVGKVDIAFERGKAKVGEGARNPLVVRIPQSMLVQLLTGYREPADLMGRREFQAPDKALPVLRALFPRQFPHVSPADSF